MTEKGMFCGEHTVKKNRKWGAMIMLDRGDHLEGWRVNERFAVRYRRV